MSLNQVCNRVVSMASNRKAKQLVENQGLAIQTVCWEDTARNKGSCWGPNISDMTLQINGHRLPVIRHPNYTDLTWDVAIDKIAVAVGNERGTEQLKQITLKEYLQDIRSYLHDSSSWKGSNNSLYSDSKDSHVLMSAQSCFLPVAQGSDSKFNVCLYNYQSTRENPRVLCIVATANGTSAQIITGNEQKLYFNKNGNKSSFIAQRLKDNRRERGVALEGEMTAEEKSQNMIVVIQIPLKSKQPIRRRTPPIFLCNSICESSLSYCAAPQPTACCATAMPLPSMMKQNKLKKMKVSRKSNVNRRKRIAKAEASCDVEAAIIKVGESEGLFNELGHLEIERDEAYPIRVTLQYYHATSNGVINQNIVNTVASQLTAAKTHADFLGSLVVNPKGDRPTERSDLPTIKPTLYVPQWWNNFWLMYKANFPTITEDEAKQQLFSTTHFSKQTMQHSEVAILQKLANGKLDPKPVNNFMTAFC